MPPARDDPRLGADDFRILRDVVNEHCGIDLTPEQRRTVERRLRDRLTMLGLESFTEYVHLLRDDRYAKTEVEEAIEALTTNETYFYREEPQIRAFHDEVIPRLARGASGRRRLSVWSAGCSTGEEVYTIATTLLDSPLLAGWDLLVYGSDISKRSLAHARRGVFAAGAFRAAPPEFRKRWFREVPEGSRVQDRVRRICHFGHLNLLDGERAPAVGRVDAIFCRNVLIYLDARARRRVIDLFSERLYPGGVLLLGHSESLVNVSTAFELMHLRTELAYRRPDLRSVRSSTPRPMRAVHAETIAEATAPSSSVMRVAPRAPSSHPGPASETMPETMSARDSATRRGNAS